MTRAPHAPRKLTGTQVSPRARPSPADRRGRETAPTGWRVQLSAGPGTFYGGDPPVLLLLFSGGSIRQSAYLFHTHAWACAFLSMFLSDSPPHFPFSQLIQKSPENVGPHFLRENKEV